MRAIWTIAKREVFSFFASPVAYVVMTAWLLWCGFSFYLLAEYFAAQPIGGGSQDSPLTAFFGQTSLFYFPLLIFVPVFTMRLIAEERHRGTLELLMTAPVDEVSVVLGKYLAGIVFWCVLWLPTLLYVWLTSRFGDVDLGVVSATYAGVFGIGLYYLAIGVLMSALAPNQIIAAILTFLTLGALFVAGLGSFVFEDQAREVFAYISIWGHMEAFSHGIVDSRYLTFDVTVAALCLALAVGVLQLRRVEG
ncbi:MAG: ABC transporter permease [Sandaracinaceae bacterium]|nr:ABC transporter permease [Sandaracinaceae bacterium]